MSDSTTQPVSEDPSAARYVVIARRYRPQTFEELVGQEHVARALQQAIKSDRVGHAYLFTGARGTGKTSAARILAKALNCEHGPTPVPCNRCEACHAIALGSDVDVIEIDGASNRGIDEIRQLRQNAAIRPSRVRFKIYIIDEVHMLTKEAFNALLKTLEEPPEHVKFIFATTEPQKIPITILSRCQRFDFAGIDTDSIQERLAQIASAEGVRVEPDALQILARRAAGSMRDSQSLLEQLLAVGNEEITANDVTQLLGIAPAERLGSFVQHLVSRDAAAALAELDATIKAGVEVGLLLDQLVGYFRDAMAMSVGCRPDQMLYAPPSQAAEVTEVSQQLGLATILAIGQILDHAAARMRVSVHARTLVEMAIVRICQLGELDDLAAVIAELRGDESVLANTASRPIVPPTKRVAAPPLSPPHSEAVPSPSAKKNGEVTIVTEPVTTPATATSLPQRDRQPPLPNEQPVSGPLPAAIRRDPPHETGRPSEVSTASASANSPTQNTATAVDSVLAQYQRAMAQGGLPPAPAAPARLSRREQLSQVAEQPFVRRAIELFDAQADKIRYTPPENSGES